MSAEQLPCIQKLKQEQEQESYRSREKCRQSGREKSSQKGSPKREQSEEKPKTEVKVVIDQEKVIEKRASIFAARKENENKSNIFANSKSVNLFSHSKPAQQNGALNIFTLPASAQPLVPNDPEDDLVSHSSEGPEVDNKEFVTEPSQKVMKYQYGEQTQKLAEFKLTRFKNGGEPVKENVYCVLEAKNGLLLFIVRNQITKVVVYQAWLLPINKVETFMNRSQNLKTSAILTKTTDGAVKLQSQTIKMQFHHPEEAQLFRKVLQDLRVAKEETNKEKKEGETVENNVEEKS